MPKRKYTPTKWNNDSYLIKNLTDRYRIKFSHFKSRPYVHIRDLGRNCDEEKLSEHRFITLHRDATLELLDVLPLFAEGLLEFDETGDPECLKKTRGKNEQREEEDGYSSSAEESEAEETEQEDCKKRKTKQPKKKPKNYKR